MRKPDEIALYAALRRRASMAGPFDLPWSPGVHGIEEEAARLGIPEKRAFGIVEKWSDRGWWNYGVSLRAGWFTPDAPETLEP